MWQKDCADSSQFEIDRAWEAFSSYFLAAERKIKL
jgi:hypothetical protein